MTTMHNDYRQNRIFTRPYSHALINLNLRHECMFKEIAQEKNRKESRAVASKPRDAAAVLFGLKFADNIHYKFE